MIVAPIYRDFETWRKTARELLAQNVHYDKIQWKNDESEFIFGDDFVDKKTVCDIRLPKSFIETAYKVAFYRDDSTWNLLYRIAWRLHFEDKNLLHIRTDADIREFEAREHSVGRDLHKMHAFVRFREVKSENETIFMAWHRPDHRILRLAAPFFKDRFNGMKWIIMTEDESVSWNQQELSFLPGVTQEELPPDEKEDLWKTYYSSTFNPARVKEKMMKKEMAVRYWKSLPETELISGLLASAQDRLEDFYESHSSAPQIKTLSTLEEIATSLKSCQACTICPNATAPVAGVGPIHAKIAFIGEQPGHEEDLKGEPFIGPAGQLLMEAFNQVGFKREEVYLSNAVKGFKWVRGYIDRQHRSPGAREISACRPWLQNEINIVKPKVLVCLGRTAAQSVLGKAIKLEDERGKFFKTALSDHTIICQHPAAILRMQDPEEKQLAFERFFQELNVIKELVIKLEDGQQTQNLR